MFYLKVCRDGKNLELRKENERGEVIGRTRFRHSETPEVIAGKLSASGIFNKRLWIYFHCMYGNNGIFQQLSLPYIAQIADNGSDNIVLSVIWPANKTGYRRNWKKAIEKGHCLGNFITCIARQQKGPVNIISHSMGNRVFQGVWQATGNSLMIENVILAAADLDAGIFAHDFKNLSSHAKRIIVVRHDQDRLLLASTLIHGRERLGRTRSIKDAPANLVTVDATPYASIQKMDMSNHLHFIFSDSVRCRLRSLAR